MWERNKEGLSEGQGLPKEALSEMNPGGTNC